MNIKNIRRRFKRRIAEILGVEKYAWPGLNGLDKSLISHIGRNRGGYFIEAGANDGYNQSNTYYLERFLGWSGLLIEPIPELYTECKKNRPGSIVLNKALTSNLGEGNLTLFDAGLMSISDNPNRGLIVNPKSHAESLSSNGKKVSVPTTTLTQALIDAGAPKRINLLSLDVEGFEVEALKGLDLSQFTPEFILVESRNLSQILNALNGRYKLIATLSQRDSYEDVLLQLC